MGFPLEAPLAASLSVLAARDAYLVENGFSAAAYDAPWADLVLLGLRLRVPNTPRHRRALMLHDLHHVATGYGTDLAGEGEITAWELGRGGLFAFGLYVALVWLSGVLVGLVVAPRRTLRAWRRAGRASSLYQSPRGYDELLAMSVGELRRELALPAAGLATAPRRLHARAPRPDA